ncbi:MAG TPA: arylsulfotransferase family protein [Novosphingobium sp.]|nr:arylsulfotransferase family protein [Novosphingobium sp.]
MAYVPQFFIDTWNNLRRDPYDESRIPDEFGGKYRYFPVPNHTTHRIEGVVMRRGDSGSAPEAGWRLLYGIFQIDGEPRYAVLALSPGFAIEHVWLISQNVLSESGKTVGSAYFPHGMALLRDGSIVAGFDEFYRTVRVSACGKRIWTSQAKLNHAIYPVDGERFVWGVGADDHIQKIDLRTGRMVQDISIEDLRRANPDLTVLEMRRIDDNALGQNARGDPGDYFPDAYHVNDAEPLMPQMAAKFPQFRAGDLLISLRSLNLVAVLDPKTRRIKWLTSSYTLRQHDPDWEPDGTISVFDNQMGRHFSRVVDFDPATNRYRTVVNGRPLNFYSRIRGKHQLLRDGGVLISSAEQGRLFELGPDGRISSEILIQDPRNAGVNFVFSEGILFPPDDPVFEKVNACSR